MIKLLLKLKRDIFESKGQFFSITVVILIGAFLFTGLSSVSKSLNSYVDSYYTENNLSDLTAYYSNLAPESINEVKKIDGVQDAEPRMIVDGTHVFSDYNATLRIHSIPVNNKINKSVLVDGTLPSNDNEIVLDSDYASEHDFKLNSSITIDINSESHIFNLVGLVENPEYAMKLKDVTQFLPTPKTYGIAYVSENSIKKLTGALQYNQILVAIDDKKDVAKIANEVENVTADNGFLYIIQKEKNASYTYLNGLINTNKVLSRSVPILFFIVASLITYITMSRTAELQRNQIGIMKALGIKKRQIMSYFLGYSLLTGLVGSLLGGLCGFLVFKQIGVNQVTGTYSLPDFSVDLDLLSLIPVVLLSIGLGILASYLSCRKVLQESSASAMRPKAPLKVTKTLIERNKKLWGKLSYSTKLLIRNIFMNKKRTLFNLFSAIMGFLLLLIALGYNASMNEISRLETDVIHTYDLKVDYKDSNEVMSQDFSDFSNASYSLQNTAVQVGDNDTKSDLNLVVSNIDNNLIHLMDVMGNEIPKDDKGIIIPKTIADKYKYSVGDSITVHLSEDLYEGKRVNLTISEIANQYSNQFAFVSSTLFSEAIGEYTPRTIMISLKDKSQLNHYIKDFKENEGVLKTTTNKDLRESMDSILSQTAPIVIIFMIGALSLVIASTYNISSINIFERRRDIATLKVLGYSGKRQNRLIANENIIIAIIGIILAAPLADPLFNSFVQSMVTDTQSIPTAVHLNNYLLSGISVIAVTVIVSFLLRGKIKKIDMIESLKSVE